MITVQQARQFIQDQVRDFGTEQVPLAHAPGRVLRENWLADRPLPPYDRISMDGIAIAYASFANGQRSFPIVGMAAAGTPQQQLTDATTCLEAMTGAVLPKGADTIIRYEDLKIEAGMATIVVADISAGQNVHTKGSDRVRGDLLLSPGKKLSAAEIGLGATLGCTAVSVSRLPRTIIISTGDELIPISEQPLPHQIRRSNVHRLWASLKAEGIEADTAHLDDDLDQLRQQLPPILSDYELVILSGGVSKGKYDFLPQVLQECGVVQHFHRVQQRPGKPLWFGTHPAGSTIFALPGNPVSSFMCTQVYVLPWLRDCLRQTPPAPVFARLAEPVTFKPDLVYFMTALVYSDEQGCLWAAPKKGRGSGDLANLIEGNAFVALPQGAVDFGVKSNTELFQVYYYRYT